MGGSRFACASSVLSPRAFLRKARRPLWVALVAAGVFHACLSRVGWTRYTAQAARPLTTRFVKRQPRLSKPLELKKRPRPKQRRLQRQMVAVRARGERGRKVGLVSPSGVLSGLVRPQSSIYRTAGLGTQEEDPKAVAVRILSDRDPEGKVDLLLEMVDMDALDTGQYHAMVVQDPVEKRNVKGYLHLYIAYPRTVSAGDVTWHSSRARHDHAYVVLVEGMNRYTGIRTDIAARITFDSAELFKTPWVYRYATPVKAFRLTGSEAANLGSYLLAGGFLFADGHQWKGSRGDLDMRIMIRDALAAANVMQGKDWNFEVLPTSHAVYHCYFDFSGPPKGSQPSGVREPDYPLEGVHYGERLVAIMSNRWYTSPWANWGWWPGYLDLDNTRQVQFGVNLIVFALTQEGSITSQVMDAVH